MRDLPEQEYRRMTEYAIRSGEQAEKARKSASMGGPPARKGRPPVVESTKAAIKDFDGF